MSTQHSPQDYFFIVDSDEFWRWFVGTLLKNYEGRELTRKELGVKSYNRQGHYLTHARLPDGRRIEIAKLGEERPMFDRKYALFIEHGHHAPWHNIVIAVGIAFELHLEPHQGNLIQVKLTGPGNLYGQVAEAILYQFPKAEDTRHATSDNLTEREKEVARLLAAGMNDDEIAKELVIAKGTSQVNRRNIREKWGMSTQEIGEMQREARSRGYGRGMKE